jgi:type IV secretory pathway TrbD component
MNLRGDLKDPKWMYLKAALFLLAGTAAAIGIFVENPTWRTAFLLGIVIWSFCRLYYFMFYVVEKYIDPGYRFASITSFVLYLLRKRK